MRSRVKLEKEKVVQSTNSLPQRKSAQPSILPDARLEHDANVSVRTSALLQMQQLAGNDFAVAMIERVKMAQHGGSPVDDATRRSLESKFGEDFSGVRVHKDEEAHQLAAAVHAKAFTSGEHIFFGEKYSPHDRELLEHEAAHVVQQRHNPVVAEISRRSDPSEKSVTEGGDVVRRFQQRVPFISRQADNTATVIEFEKGSTIVASPPPVVYWPPGGAQWDRFSKLSNELINNGWKIVDTGVRDRSVGTLIWRVIEPDGRVHFINRKNALWLMNLWVERVRREKETSRARGYRPEKNVRFLKDPEVAEEDPNLVADTPEGVKWWLDFGTEYGPYILMGKEIPCCTKFGSDMFVARIGLYVYYEKNNTIRRCALGEFIRGYELALAAKKIYEATSWIVPVAEVEGLVVSIVLNPAIAMDVVGNIIAGKSILDEEAFRGYCATAILGPLSKFEYAWKAKIVVEVLKDAATAAGSDVVKDLLAQGYVNWKQVPEDVLKSLFIGRFSKRIAKLPEGSKRLLEETNEKLREVASGVISKELEAGYEVGKEAVR